MLDNYPIPEFQTLMAEIPSGKKNVFFTQLDLKHAYSQLQLDEASAEMTTLNTHKGLLEYKRLPFGISSAPGMFQKILDGLIGNQDGVLIYLDDILLVAESDDELLKITEQVF